MTVKQNKMNDPKTMNRDVNFNLTFTFEAFSATSLAGSSYEHSV